MELIKKLLSAVLGAGKGLLDMANGKMDEEKLKKLTMIGSSLFIAICVFKSLRALSAAKKEAAARR